MDYNELVNKGRNFNEHKYLYKDKSCKLLSTDHISIKIKELKDNDEYLDAFINQIKEDGNNLYNEDVESRKIQSNTYENREGISKYYGTDNRKKADEMAPGERKCEARIHEKYELEKHPKLGYAMYHQSPIVREKGRDGLSEKMDLVFNNDDEIFICELKDIDAIESLLSAISEILTYYYCVLKHINVDGDNRYFYKAFAKEYNDFINYKIIPCIIVPDSMISASKIFLDSLITKLKKYGIDFRYFILEYKDPFVKVN